MAFECSGVLADLAKNLECCICYKIFLDPVTSSCGRHSYCERCLKTHLEKNAERRCPECREPFPSDYKPQKNVTLCSIVNVLGRQNWQNILSDESSVSNIWSDGQEKLKPNVAAEPASTSCPVQDIQNTLDLTASTSPVYRDQPEERPVVRLSEEQSVSERPEVGAVDPSSRPMGCFERLTFSPILRNGRLSFSEDRRKAMVRKQGRLPLKQHSHFSVCQVMAEQEFIDGAHYWHVDCSECSAWTIGVAYACLGHDDHLGRTAASWCLEWSKQKLSYWHNNKEEQLNHTCLRRITVSLDIDNGQLSFYGMHGDGAMLLHSASVHFQEPVRPAFWLFGLRCGNSLVFTGP